MILAFDTSTAACTAALFDGVGACLASADEPIGRGHAERLVPLLAELLDGRRAEQILVGVGPGSFTGIRVAIAAAHGLAIGWDADIAGLSTMALIAAGHAPTGTVGIALSGGHSELFVQQFDGLIPTTDVLNLAPAAAAREISADLVLGSGAEALVAARGWGRTVASLPSAAHALAVSSDLRSLPPKPLYGRAPDARPRVAA